MNLNAIIILFSTKLLPLLYAIISFSLLVTIHEFGHFIFCKIFGVYTPTFSIGMGPKVIEKKIGNTNFRLSALPLGGYVEIAGLSEIGQGEQKYSNIKGESSFAEKPYWQKCFILCGGVLFNLLFAYIIYSMLFFIGIPKKKIELFISNKIKTEITKEFKLKADDKIIEINGKHLNANIEKTFRIIKNELIKPLSKNIYQKINLKISRDNKIETLQISTENKKLNNLLLKSFQMKSIEIKGKFEKYPFVKAIIKGIKTTNQWIIQMFAGLKYLITQRSLKGAGGPIMIISKTFETAQKGLIPLFIFLAFISINLAIINILPIGALDGGQLLFVTIEAIIRRQIPEIIKYSINMFSWVLLIGLILYLSYKDLITLITGKIN